MYPIKFENIYFEKIWGGRALASFRNNLPDGDIGESWDVACHPNGTSVIANGEYKGWKLDAFIKEKGEAVIGTAISNEWFPLLLKLIYANDELSVQVHPDDEYGMRVEGEMGKTEAWYVVDAEVGASIIVGTEHCTKEDFRRAIETGDLDHYLKFIPVSKGDVFYVKSGLVHALGRGVVVAEIQQNSDTTYRVYDYNRGRELHIDKAMDVIDLSLEEKRNTGLTIQQGGFSKTYLCYSRHFSLEMYDIQESCVEQSDRERFYIFTCVDGEGEVHYAGGKETLKKGDSILIPALLGQYTLSGGMKLLKSYVPNVEKLSEEILNLVRF